MTYDIIYVGQESLEGRLYSRSRTCRYILTIIIIIITIFILSAVTSLKAYKEKCQQRLKREEKSEQTAQEDWNGCKETGAKNVKMKDENDIGDINI